MRKACLSSFWQCNSIFKNSWIKSLHRELGMVCRGVQIPTTMTWPSPCYGSLFNCFLKQMKQLNKEPSQGLGHGMHRHPNPNNHTRPKSMRRLFLQLFFKNSCCKLPAFRVVWNTLNILKTFVIYSFKNIESYKNEFLKGILCCKILEKAFVLFENAILFLKNSWTSKTDMDPLIL